MIFYDAFDLGNWSWTISADAILLWVAAFLVLGIGILTLVDFLNKKGENDLIWSAVFIGLFMRIYLVITSGSWERFFIPYFGSIAEIIAGFITLAIPGLIATALIRKTLGKKKIGDLMLLLTLVMTSMSTYFLIDPASGVWTWVPIALSITQLIIIIPGAVVMIAVPLLKKTDNKASLIFAFGCIFLAVVYIIVGMLGVAVAIEKLDVSTQGGLADFGLALLPFLILGAAVCFFDSLIVKPKKWKNLEVS
jgi:hypothetical protein